MRRPELSGALSGFYIAVQKDGAKRGFAAGLVPDTGASPMSILTYDRDRSHDAPAVRPAGRRKGFWRSLMDAMIASRMRHAEREIARHRHIVELEQNDWSVCER